MADVVAAKREIKHEKIAPDASFVPGKGRLFLMKSQHAFSSRARFLALPKKQGLQRDTP